MKHALRCQPNRLALATIRLNRHRFCDDYLFLMPHDAQLLKAHEIARVGPVTASILAETFDRLRDRAHS
jgi:hypothetical protein